MIALNELIGMLPDDCIPNIPDRLASLFMFLKEQEHVLTEEEAALRFFKTPNKGKYFNKLKNELKRALIGYIIASPSVWVDAAYKTQHNECYKSFTAYKLLLLGGKRKAAIEMAKVLLPKLQQYELHGLINIVATDLRFHYASMDISKSMTQKYHELCLQQTKIIQAESIIRAQHSKVALLQNTRESYSQEVIDTFRSAAQISIPFLSLKSNYLNRFIYNILLSRYMSEFDYSNIIKTCDEALESIPADYQNRTALQFTYLQMKLPALIVKRKLHEAKKIAKKSYHMMPTGNFNWHLAILRRIIVCLHAADYQEAYELYKAHSKQECHYPTLREYWDIIWGYLYFLIKKEKIQEYTLERFHLGKFLNDTPMYSKDKSGHNINLFIIQIIIRIQREQFGQVIDRIEALRIYTRTYTKNPETKRANIFLNMIIRMEAASFHRVATERKTKHLFEQLQKTPIHLGQNLAIEMIPYEVLWEEILDLLEGKFRGVKVSRATKNIN